MKSLAQVFFGSTPSRRPVAKKPVPKAPPPPEEEAPLPARSRPAAPPRPREDLWEEDSFDMESVDGEALLARLLTLRAGQVERAVSTLTERARSDRLEAAVPFIKALEMALSRRKTPSAPPGTLSVSDWIRLVNQWDFLCGHVRPWQFHHILSFFQEVHVSLERSESPLSSYVTGIMEVVERHATRSSPKGGRGLQAA